MRAGLLKPLLLMLALALPAIALFAGLPAHPKFLAVLNNAAHAPIFGAFAAIVLRLIQPLSTRPRWTTYFLAWIYTVAIGVAVEVIQPSLGRDAELEDLVVDALGATAGLALVALFRRGQRLLPAIIFAFTSALLAWPIIETGLGYWERSRQVPAILEVTSPWDWVFIWSHGFQVTETKLPEIWHKPSDPRSIRLRVKTEPWRTLTLIEPIPDWRPYRRLMIDLTNSQPLALEVTLRVHDYLHRNAADDRFNLRIQLGPSSRRVVEISLADVEAAPRGRKMDLSRIAGIMIFTSGAREITNRELYVTRIWLES